MYIIGDILKVLLNIKELIDTKLDVDDNEVHFHMDLLFYYAVK